MIDTGYIPGTVIAAMKKFYGFDFVPYVQFGYNTTVTLRHGKVSNCHIIHHDTASKGNE